MDGLSHQDLPFAVLAEQIKTERDPSRSPIFQTVFVLQKPHRFGDEGLAMFFVNREGVQITLAGAHHLKVRVTVLRVVPC
jgi:hypothetical protein